MLTKDHSGKGHDKKEQLSEYLSLGLHKVPVTIFSFIFVTETCNGQKLKHRKLPLNMRKHFFTLRVTKHWHRLPGEVMETSSLKIFKSCQDMVLGNLL